MLVRADASVSVSQDGVDWVPIGLVDGALQFVVGSPGRLSISENGREIFFFYVEFEPDFSFTNNALRQFQGGTLIDFVQGGSSYCQSKFVGSATRLAFELRPASLPPSDVGSLATSSNQDVVINVETGSNNVIYRIDNFNTSIDFQFYVGNVLVGFLAPAV